MSNRTLAILKPDCVRKKVVGEVLRRIEGAGFRIAGMKMLHLTPERARDFYAVHRGKPFYEDLVKFMSSGACIPLVLEKDGAVEAFRVVIGATDPKEATSGTIRREFADNKQENIVHGSDSSETARFEIGFFFKDEELV